MQKNPEIKAVFFDIDGTLMSFKTHRVSNSTQKAIDILKEKGIYVILATGRSIQSLEHVKFLDFDGYVTFNGAFCLSKQGKVLHKQAIDTQDIQNVVEYAKKKPLSFSFMYEDDILINDVTKEVAGMYAHLNLPVPDPVDLDNAILDGVLQTNVFLPPQEEPEFMEKVMPNCDSSRWTPLFADVNPKGMSKRIGVETFCKHFNIDIKNTMAFGDGGNDLQMIQAVEMGVAMGNANPELKDVADYVTDSVDEDGIWNALTHFKVI